MKCLLVIFVVCTVLVILNGGVMASPTREDSVSDEGNRTCPMSLEGDEKYRNALLVDKAINCIITYEGIGRVDDFTTLEEFRQFFNRYCQEVPKVKNCCDNVLDTGKICLNQTNQLVQQILNGLLNTLLNKGCENNGESLAQIFYGFENDNSPNNIFNQCTGLINVIGSNSTVSPAQRMVLLYQKLKEIKNCFLYGIGSGKHELKSAIRDIFDEVRKDLKCIHPQDNILVLCSAIQDNEDLHTE